eukprot:9487376-Pyramimonas_sp.AAC.2
MSVSSPRQCGQRFAEGNSCEHKLQGPRGVECDDSGPHANTTLPPGPHSPPANICGKLPKLDPPPNTIETYMLAVGDPPCQPHNGRAPLDSRNLPVCAPHVLYNTP